MRRGDRQAVSRDSKRTKNLALYMSERLKIAVDLVINLHRARCRYQTATIPNEQLLAHGFLKLLELLADRGLSDLQDAGSPTGRSRTDNLPEYLRPPQPDLFFQMAAITASIPLALLHSCSGHALFKVRSARYPLMRVRCC